LCFIFRKRDVFEDKEVPLTEDKEFSSEDKGIVNDAQIAQNQNHEDKYENAHNIAIDHAVAVIDNVAEENEVVYDINDAQVINFLELMEFQAQGEVLNDAHDLAALVEVHAPAEVAAIEHGYNIPIDLAVAAIDNVAEENEVVFDINDVELMPINLSRWMDFQAQDEELNDVQDLDNYLALDNICVNSALLRLEFANVAETLLDVLDGEENRLVKEPIPRDLTVTDLIAFYIKEEIIKQAEDLQFINEADGADEEYEFLAN
jgi:hypothetical protein